MSKSKIAFVKKSNFLSSVKSVYQDCSLDYLINLRDSLNILISSKTGNGDNIDRVIEQSKGFVRI